MTQPTGAPSTLTPSRKSFEIAVSYAVGDEWIARDLHDLLVSSGISVFSYARHPDATGGFLRDNLTRIYEESSLNVLLWSREYAEASNSAASFPAMERRVMVHRHVHKGEAESLLIVAVDAEPIPRDLEIALIHNIRKAGLLGLEELARERLRKLGRRPTPFGTVCHPPPTEKYRGTLHACDFAVSREYGSDTLRRWFKLGDVLVDFPNNYGTKHVYLIPSGLSDVMVRHTQRFLTDPLLIEAKRRVTARFIADVGDRPLSGFWFLSRSPRASEVDVVTVYSGEYDRYLNAHFDAELAIVRREQRGA
jgi:hypothetical protein